MRIYSESVNETMRIQSMKQESPTRGGHREGAGRPSQGKTRINLSLTESLVEQARAREHNLSALLDRLLNQWLATKNLPPPSL
jgi:hypothetical protein